MPESNDVFSRGLKVPSKSINVESLLTILQNRIIYLNIGVYGSSKYGHAIYGANYGYYGYSHYGDSSYH